MEYRVITKGSVVSSFKMNPEGLKGVMALIESYTRDGIGFTFETD